MNLQEVIYTVSAFAGRGKKRTLKHIKPNNSYEEAFCQLGQSWDISTELFQKLPEITCRMRVPSTYSTKCE